MVELLKERAEAWRSVHDGLAELLAEAADLLEAVARERDEARAEAKEHLRLKKELVLKAYPAMDRADRLAEALEQIGVYGCGMLNQPAAMNGPEEAWLRRRLAEYERVARAALAATQTGEDG